MAVRRSINSVDEVVRQEVPVRIFVIKVRQLRQGVGLDMESPFLASKNCQRLRVLALL